jgi:hypothetical protein
VIYGAGSGQVPSQTGYDYDGDQRVTRQISYAISAAETWETDTDTVYPGGDATTVTYQNLESGQHDGGVPQTTFTNGEGQTSAIYQYHSEADDGGYIGVSSVDAGRFPIDEVEVILNPDGSLRNAYPAADTPDMVDGW